MKILGQKSNEICTDDYGGNYSSLMKKPRINYIGRHPMITDANL